MFYFIPESDDTDRDDEGNRKSNACKVSVNNDMRKVTYCIMDYFDKSF